MTKGQTDVLQSKYSDKHGRLRVRVNPQYLTHSQMLETKII